MPTSAPTPPGGRAGLRPRTAAIALSSAAVVAVMGLVVVPKILSPSVSEAAVSPGPASVSGGAAASVTPRRTSLTASPSPPPSATSSAPSRSEGAVHAPVNPFLAPEQADVVSPDTSAPPVPVDTSVPVASPSVTAGTSTVAPAPAETAPIGDPKQTPSTSAASRVSVRLESVSEDNMKAVVRVRDKSVTLTMGVAAEGGLVLVRAEGGSCATLSQGKDRRDLCEGASQVFG